MSTKKGTQEYRDMGGNAGQNTSKSEQLQVNKRAEFKTHKD